MYNNVENEERRPVFARYAPKIRGFCRLCGTAVRDGEGCMRYCDTLVCEDCTSDISVRQIMRICEFESREELLEMIGFTEY